VGGVRGTSLPETPSCMSSGNINFPEWWKYIRGKEKII
jgi:hypothetical protein